MEIVRIIKEKSKKYRDYTAENLSQIVRIPSLSGDEENVIKRIKVKLEKAGFNNVHVDGLGNLIGRIGNGKKILTIDAHIDTVDTGDLNRWEFEPFSGSIKNGMVLGRGSVDQKGGAASMITAGRILKEIGYNGNFSIYFTFTIMEEDCEGLCWKHLIENEKLIPHFVVSTEPTNLGVYRGQRGRMEIELNFKGVSAHGSAPERGDNAIYKASEIVLKIEKLNEKLRSDDFLGKGTVAATLITSESPSLCAIPDRCMLHLDRRLTWEETRESALKEVKDIAGKDVTVEVPVYNNKSYKGIPVSQDKHFPTWKIPENHPLIRVGVSTCQLLFGEIPVVGKWAFSTNGVVICGIYNIPTIGFGPGNEKYAHAPNERIPVDHLEKASAFYALLPYVIEGI
ncbi:YgeY family selenium metabolism-linked hydrolase [candidate division WOR-3 bacterium]|nr:YgeY family selenium metabolism-linked hydrolase [candidate division WOR-3 bacterium]